MILHLAFRGYGIGLDLPTTRVNAANTISRLKEGFEDEPVQVNISGVNGPVSNLYPYIQHTVSALEQAVKEGLIRKNPTDGCNPPKLERKEMKVIQSEQIGAYLQAAANHNVLPMFYLELTSGLRRGELLALLWTDLNLEKNSISVCKSVRGSQGELKVSAPKTRHSIRTVVIPQQAVDLLIQEHELHPDNPYMFPSPVTGTMYHPDTAGCIHRKLLKEAGIEPVRFHDLRHTFATLALQNGVDIKTLSGMLGHYSFGFTLDTYTHVTDKMQQEAAEKVGNFMEMAL